MSKKIVETHKSKTVRKESTTLGKVAKVGAAVVAAIILRNFFRSR